MRCRPWGSGWSRGFEPCRSSNCISLEDLHMFMAWGSMGRFHDWASISQGRPWHWPPPKLVRRHPRYPCPANPWGSESYTQRYSNCVATAARQRLTFQFGSSAQPEVNHQANTHRTTSRSVPMHRWSTVAESGTRLGTNKNMVDMANMIEKLLIIELPMVDPYSETTSSLP